ncbi:MAG: SMC-Scp complex subunit ScpB [Rhodospirillaceae bacterium]|jgi:segregation and condensation protein B|nr:SMC-Scp complex subunit ScpB [Rhodospirillaceae bacterium]MBT5243294.1 SMC-Scp complex subunit ScpB [Rhodospirillaceae bacterium]MBT5563922.1 SMC-Scp complex subunit ScpB [Rhodospirillaceae bacterium]MBT6240874.1 SMC-Scp complex subunit ScpB [Rhodospirillaceae bacterium]MBT7137341.1 SMC-Scp complex subunit ScpB [Rhodospirillaceae bacterium]
MNDIPDQNIRLLEAILFASTDPVKEKSLARRLPEGVEPGPLLEELKDHYQGRGVNLVNVGGSWAFRSAADLTNMLNREIEVARKLGRATVETLAIIAYHQPITRGEIEEIRGVSLSKGTFDALFDHGWIHPRGRRKTPGRPTTWGTTDGFLDHFGLESVKDLPGIEELKSAGLLDKRPAIDAYTISGQVAASAADVAHIDGAEAGDDEAELPLAADLEEET